MGASSSERCDMGQTLFGAGAYNLQSISALRRNRVWFTRLDAPRAGWKLAVVEKLITGSDGVTRAAEIRTARGTTNRPIVRLIPLEVNEQSETWNWTQVISQNDSEGIQADRPTRLATLTARNKIKQWTDEIRAAPEDVMD